MTQLILSLNGALLALQAGVILVPNLSDTITAIVVLACSVAIAFTNPWLPKVSEAIRRTMELQRRG